MFEDVACMIYDLQDARRLYHTYLQNLKLINVPCSGEKVQEKTGGGQISFHLFVGHCYFVRMSSSVCLCAHVCVCVCVCVCVGVG